MLRVLHLLDAPRAGAADRTHDVDAVATLRRLCPPGVVHTVAIAGGTADLRWADSIGLRCDATLGLLPGGSVAGAARALRAFQRRAHGLASPDVLHAWSARLANAAREVWPRLRVCAGAPWPGPIDASRLSPARRRDARHALGIEEDEWTVGLLPAWRGRADAARCGLAVGLAAFTMPRQRFVCLVPPDAHWLDRAVVFARRAFRLWRFVIDDSPAWDFAAASDMAAAVYPAPHAQRAEPMCDPTALAWAVAAGIPVVTEVGAALDGCGLPEEAGRVVRVSLERETLAIGSRIVEALADGGRDTPARAAGARAVARERDPARWTEAVLAMYERPARTLEGREAARVGDGAQSS